MGMEGDELTEQETALYDRQIRVWGADAQRRLSKSHIFVCGMKGTVAEFCKNIVLAGVGSLTLVDDRPVNEEAHWANFLISPDENVCAGKSVAEVCCESLKEFNPMVRVTAEKGNISSFNVEYFNKFDIVIISCCSLETKKLINEKCRRLVKRVGLYTVDCKGSCGEIFADLKNFSYSMKAVAVPNPRKSLPKRMSKLYFALRVIEKFEQAEGSNPWETSVKDLSGVLKLRKELCDAHSFVPESLLARLITDTREFPPVTAIIGGILGQEVIKVISGKGDPVKNFFLLTPWMGKAK